MSGPLSGIVLAGGSSRRLGIDKNTLTFAGQCLLEIVIERASAVCTEVIVACGSRSFEPWRGPPVRFVPDAISGQGPLAGLHAALTAAREEFALVVACDMPFLSPRLLAYMAALPRRYEALVPLVDGRWHPAHAVYARSCLPMIEGLLAQGRNKMEDLIDGLRVQPLSEDAVRGSDPGELSLFNLNTARDLTRARALWRTAAARLEVASK